MVDIYNLSVDQENYGTNCPPEWDGYDEEETKETICIFCSEHHSIPYGAAEYVRPHPLITDLHACCWEYQQERIAIYGSRVLSEGQPNNQNF